MRRELNAGDVVAAYVRGRSDVGVGTPEAYRRILGSRAKALLGRGWSPEVVISAAVNFGSQRKHPSFLLEWVEKTQKYWDEAEYAIRKAQEMEPFTPEVAAILQRATMALRMPKPLTDEQLRQVVAGPKCYECALSGRMEACRTCNWAQDQVRDREAMP